MRGNNSPATFVIVRRGQLDKIEYRENGPWRRIWKLADASRGTILSVGRCLSGSLAGHLVFSKPWLRALGIRAENFHILRRINAVSLERLISAYSFHSLGGTATGI